jgi:biopolymer transport protein TolR
MATSITTKKTTSRKSRQLMSEINITPFVDVMLVLLVVFMVTAPMMISGINVNLPKTVAAPISGNDEPLTVTVTQKGTIYIQDIEINLQDLASKLAAVTHEKKDSRILVRGDKNANYGDIMQVVGSINQAGYSHISLVTQLEEKK